jgi:hypothetical protein
MFRARRGKGWLVVTILGFAILVPLSIGMGWQAHELTKWLAGEHGAEAIAEWVHVIFFLLWLMLVAMPVLGFGANEFYDITKLFVFPVSHRSVFLGQAIGMTFSGTALFFLPTLLGLAAGIPGSPGIRLLRMGGAVLLVFHAVAFAQLIQLLLLNLLRSRRFRDLMPIVAALFSGAIYLSFRFFSHVEDPRQWIAAVLERGLSDYLAPLPVYWLTGVVAPGADGGRFLLFVFGFLPFTALTVVLSGLLQEKAFLGNVAGGRVRPATTNGPRRLRVPFPLSRLPGTVRAIMGNEYRLLRREPVVKAMIIQQLVFFLVPVGFVVYTSESAEVALGMSVYALLLVESILALNLLGLEGPGIVQLLTTSVSRKRILWGKIAANLFLWLPVNVLFLTAVSTALGVFSRAPTPFQFVGLLVESLSGLLVLLGLGAVLSVRAPVRLGARDRRALSQGQTGEGCLNALIRLAAFLVLLFLMIPVILLCRIFEPKILMFAAPFYGWLILWLGVSRSARRIKGREERLIEALARSVS